MRRLSLLYCLGLICAAAAVSRNLVVRHAHLDDHDSICLTHIHTPRSEGFFLTCVTMCLSPFRSWTPEDLVRWNLPPDLKNVPRSASGPSAAKTTGYGSPLHLHVAGTSSFLLSDAVFLPVPPQGSKCPSGCRIQGLMNKYDHGLQKKTEKIRSLLDQNKVKHRSADEVSKQTYSFLREKLTVDSGLWVT